MEKWNGRVALVTGASMGIGEVVSKSLVKHGLKVVGCARSLDKLENIQEELQVGPGTFHPYECDLRDEEQILKMFEWIKTNFKGVDICINNGGLALNAPLGSGSTEDWRNMLDVNVLALSICSREAIQSMKSKGVEDGHIININSTSGHRIMNYEPLHFYAATKHMVTALTKALRNELRAMNTKIRITSISPGIVETNFWKNSYDEKPKRTFPCLESEDIRDVITYVLSAPEHVEINEVIMRPTEQKT